MCFSLFLNFIHTSWSPQHTFWTALYTFVLLLCAAPATHAGRFSCYVCVEASSLTLYYGFFPRVKWCAVVVIVVLDSAVAIRHASSCRRATAIMRLAMMTKTTTTYVCYYYWVRVFSRARIYMNFSSRRAQIRQTYPPSTVIEYLIYYTRWVPLPPSLWPCAASIYLQAQLVILLLSCCTLIYLYILVLFFNFKSQWFYEFLK